MNTLTINDLKIQINEKHNILTDGLKKSVKLAMQIGSLLTQAKKELEHGQFIDWIENNCTFHRKSAYNYMRLYEHKDKCANVSHLTEAYKKIEQIEYEKKNVEQRDKQKVDMKKVKENMNDYKDDADWQETKAKCFDDKETVSASDLLTDEVIDNLKQQAEEEKKFKAKISNANNNQDAFFNAINIYLNELKNDNEKLEAVQNIIKYCKRIAVKYQQESIKS